MERGFFRIRSRLLFSLTPRTSRSSKDAASDGINLLTGEDEFTRPAHAIYSLEHAQFIYFNLISRDKTNDVNVLISYGAI